MISFLKSRGCVITFNSESTNNNSSGYALEKFPKGADGRPILLMEANLTHKDLVLPITTLSNKKVLYSFGSDFGTASLTGIIFLGKAGEATPGVTAVKTWYDTNSIGNKTKGKPVKLSLSGKTAMSMYIIGLSFGQPNAELNYIPFTIAAIEA